MKKNRKGVVKENMVHRFSPFGTRGIKRTPKKVHTKEEKEKRLVNELCARGYSREESEGILSYCEKLDVPHAIRAMRVIEETCESDWEALSESESESETETVVIKMKKRIERIRSKWMASRYVG